MLKLEIHCFVDVFSSTAKSAKKKTYFKITLALTYAIFKLFMKYFAKVYVQCQYIVYKFNGIKLFAFYNNFSFDFSSFFVCYQKVVRNNRRGRAKILILKLFRAKKVIGSQFCINEYDFNRSIHTIYYYVMCFRRFNYMIKFYLLIYILLETFKNCFNCCSKML